MDLIPISTICKFGDVPGEVRMEYLAMFEFEFHDELTRIAPSLGKV